MRIIVAHNFYQQSGGEDQVFAAETALLEKNGHAVERFVLHNDAVNDMGMMSLAASTVWNRKVCADLRALVKSHRADVVHFHNTFPLMSPAAYRAARGAGAAVVQTLHNYRLLCPAATCFRDGKVCESCIGRAPLASVVHGCYRGSRAVTAVAAASLMIHRSLGTYDSSVDAYIALTEFARRKHIDAGLPADRVVVKPNFIDPDPGIGTGAGKFTLFVGRLAPEKGISSLLAAWKMLDLSMPLKICGDGPMADAVKAAAAANPFIQWEGRRPLEQVLKLMGDAVMLIFPSIWYEGMPRTIIEAYAKGTPVVASDLGSMQELVIPGETGERFAPGDKESLVSAVRRMTTDPTLLAYMRSRAREEYERKYMAERNLPALCNIYEQAIIRRSEAEIRGICVSPWSSDISAPVTTARY